jgi:hypothetical protein
MQAVDSDDAEESWTAAWMDGRGLRLFDNCCIDLSAIITHTCHCISDVGDHQVQRDLRKVRK